MNRRVKHIPPTIRLPVRTNIPGPSAAQTNPIPAPAAGVPSCDPRIGFVSRDRSDRRQPGRPCLFPFLRELASFRITSLLGHDEPRQPVIPAGPSEVPCSLETAFTLGRPYHAIGEKRKTPRFGAEPQEDRSTLSRVRLNPGTVIAVPCLIRDASQRVYVSQ
jgi:hypothetical protein